MKAKLMPSALHGVITVPPSKSYAHRLLICAALAGGGSTVGNIDYSVDIKATLGAMQHLGSDAVSEGEKVTMLDSGRMMQDGAVIDCAESGSTLRMIIPLFSLLGRTVSFTGAPRLFARPMDVYADLFKAQGLRFTLEEQGLQICGPLHSGEYQLRGDVSSQFISGLLFALPLLKGGSLLRITPPFESRDYVVMTQQAQRLFGVESVWQDENTLYIKGGQRYMPQHTVVEGDWSQAAVPAVLAAIGGGVDIAGLSADSAQGDRVILDVLRRCGASIEWQDSVLRVRGNEHPLVAAGDIDMSNCPDLGPILCTLGLFCKGTTRLVNAGRLRIKESDRIASIEQELSKLGALVSSTEDTISVAGGRALRTGQTVESHNDHRVVMAMTAASIAGGFPLEIEGAEAITKSWPGFFDDMKALGAKVVLQ